MMLVSVHLDVASQRSTQKAVYGGIVCFSSKLEEYRQQEESLSAQLERGRQRSEEVTQELGQVLEELRNARLDSQESRRQLQRKELLEKLCRLFPEAVVRDARCDDCKNTVRCRRRSAPVFNVTDEMLKPQGGSSSHEAHLLLSSSLSPPQYGRLYDLCSPIHKKYQLAVTKVFGRYMNAIVVATEKVARDCISFIKEERAEPETFLPIDYLDVS